MHNGLFTSSHQMSDSTKCFLAACAILSTVLIAIVMTLFPFLAFVACLYAGWELSWKLIVALAVSRRKRC